MVHFLLLLVSGGRTHMLALVRQRLAQAGIAENRCTLIEGLFPGTPVEPHDYAIVMGVMDYVEDASSFLKSLRPAVRHLATLSFPSVHWFRTPFRKVRYNMRNCPVYFYIDDRIRALCEEAGFTEIDIKKIPGAGMDCHVAVRP